MASSSGLAELQEQNDAESSREKNRGNRHACERCRKSKVRCLVDTLDEHGKCRRCFESGAQCIFAAIAPRQRRKRTDARVTSLEKQLNEMKSLFDQLNAGNDVQTGAVKHLESSSSLLSSSDLEKTPSSHLTSPATTEDLQNLPQPPQDLDYESFSHDADHQTMERIFKSCNLSQDDASRLFSQFVADLLPRYPIVHIASNANFEHMYKTKPILSFAAIAASSCSSSSRQFKMLHSELLKILAEKVVVNGEKSLELLQAILVMECWYCPPDDLKKLNFYQWIHIAGTMALQLGIGGRLAPTADDESHYDSPALSDAQLEAWRTMFAVYIDCSSVAISLRRQRMISYTSVAETKLSRFEKMATSINDKRLAATLRLQLIADNVEHLKATSPSPISSVQNHLRQLQDKFKAWEEKLDPGIMTGPLKVQLHFWEGKLFERLMHTDSDLEELIPPLVAQAPPSSPAKSPPTDLNPAYVRAVLGFINACHSTLDAILQIEPRHLRSCPTVILIRTVHAIKALKMLDSAVYDSTHNLGKVIDSDGLQLQHYSQLLDGHLAVTSGENKCRVPTMVRNIIQKITNSSDARSRMNATEIPATSIAYGQSSTTERTQAQSTSQVDDGSSSLPKNLEAESVHGCDSLVQPGINLNDHVPDTQSFYTHLPFGPGQGVPSLEHYVHYNSALGGSWGSSNDLDLMMMPDLGFTYHSVMDSGESSYGDMFNHTSYDSFWGGTEQFPHPTWGKG